MLYPPEITIDSFMPIKMFKTTTYPHRNVCTHTYTYTRSHIHTAPCHSCVITVRHNLQIVYTNNYCSSYHPNVRFNFFPLYSIDTTHIIILLYYLKINTMMMLLLVTSYVLPLLCVLSSYYSFSSSSVFTLDRRPCLHLEFIILYTGIIILRNTIITIML